MSTVSETSGPPAFVADLRSGVVVFLVAVPLCLGVAVASGAAPFSGLLAGIIGGLIVGTLSGSHTSVSGPAAGLTAVVSAQILALGFDAFLLAVFIAGVMQVALGIARAGHLASFFPTSVIKGLLAAIGVILILKQIPHLLGDDNDAEGDFSFWQLDGENTLSELGAMLGSFHPGAFAVGIGSLLLLTWWGRSELLKKIPVPAPLVIVLLGAGINLLFGQVGGRWEIKSEHLVEVPIAASLSEFIGFLTLPDFSAWTNPAVYTAAVTIAAVASLETLLNLEAVDKLDRQQRHSPPSRELIAQGVGNMTAGLVGAIPVTSVIVRSSVNIDSGGRTRFAAIFHGFLLVVSVSLFPGLLNQIPLASLAAILIVTGFKLISPATVKRMWDEGLYQFVPFVITVAAIVFTDLLVGVVIGLLTAVSFILNSNVRRPLRRFVEQHLGGDVLHVQLASQVSFLNRVELINVFDSLDSDSHLLLDATGTDYIDPDVLDLIRDFRDITGPARGVDISLIGFREQYQLQDEIQYVDYSTRDLQEAVTPQQVLRILQDGHERFRTGRRLTRDLGRQVSATAEEQHPLAVVISCIDSRTPAELIFDLGVGDIFSVRVAGNVLDRNVIGSIEYACAVAGAKLVLVMGHTRCGAVTTAVDICCDPDKTIQSTGCDHLEEVVHEIQQVMDHDRCSRSADNQQARQELVDDVARKNVDQFTEQLTERSRTVRDLVNDGKVAVVGAMYDVATGQLNLSEPQSTTT